VARSRFCDGVVRRGLIGVDRRGETKVWCLQQVAITTVGARYNNERIASCSGWLIQATGIQGFFFHALQWKQGA
jgi:hypothetical protein